MRTSPLTAERVQRSLSEVRKLRDLIRTEILHSEDRANHLPSETALMMEYNVTRATVREALALLRVEGLIDRVPGVGTIVAANPVCARLVEGDAKDGEVSTPPAGTRPRILESAVVPLPRSIAHRLGSDAADCLRVDYVLLLEDDPAAVITNYVLFPAADALQRVPFLSNWYEYLALAGITVGNSEFAFGAESADAGVGALMGIPVGDPVLLVEQVLCDERGERFNFAVMHVRSDRLMFSSQGPVGFIPQGARTTSAVATGAEP